MKFKHRIITLLLFSILSVIKLYAQIEMQTLINDTVVLSKTDSFYYTNATISVGTTGCIIIEKGVELRFASGTRLNVNGKIEVLGSADSMVLFNSTGEGIRWGYISTNSADVNLNYLKVNGATRFVTANYGNVTIKNCKVENTYGGIGDDCIGVHYASSLLITGCDLNGNPDMARIDAMDLDDISNGIVSNNEIKNFEDDGVDVGTGTTFIHIKDNFIYNCNFGISVGESSTVTAERNIIVNCDAGFQSHTGSNVTATNNTLYANAKGVECHHASAANSGGSITLNSCIISQTVGSLYTLQTNSQLTAKYSLSDTDTLPGENNIFGNPKFIYPDTFNFNLNDSSPCINNGDPSLQVPDSGGLIIDIGAIEYLKNNDTNTLSFEIKSLSEIIIYPNPNTGGLNFKGLKEIDYNYRILSIDGKICDSGSFNTSSQTLIINNLKRGFYYIILENKNRRYISQFFMK